MDEHIGSILKMLAEGKISAAEAEKLLSALKAAPTATPQPPPAAPQPPPPPPPGSRFGTTTRTETTSDSSSTSSSTADNGNAKQFDFSWGHKKNFPFDLSGLGKQISDAVKKIDPEKLVREARVGVSKGGKRWQDRMKEWSRFMTGEDGPPENTLGQPTARTTENLIFQVTPDATIQLENSYGAIYIVGGSQDVSVEIEKEAWAYSEEEARLKLHDLKAEALTQQSPTLGASRLEIRVHAPEDWRDGLATLRLRVPDGVSLKVETVFGEIRVENTAGYVEAHAISGAITLENLGGEVRAEAISGDIRAVKIAGHLRAASKSGDLSIEDISQGGEMIAVSGTVNVRRAEGARLEAKSVSGDVFLEDAGKVLQPDITVESVSGDVSIQQVRGSSVRLKTISGDVTANGLEATTVQGETVSGDLKVVFSAPFSGTLTTNTVSGDVKVNISQTSSFRFTLGTQSGDVTNHLSAHDTSKTDTLLTGVVGNGDGTVTIHTRSGDVSLDPTDNE
jgi:DUF4097 and DUF4098 domain-containing protein YvlB